MDYAFGMDDLENDIFLQTAVRDFARARRIKRLQLVVGAILIFALGFLAGTSYQYQSPTFIVELPASAPPMEGKVTKTTET